MTEEQLKTEINTALNQTMKTTDVDYKTDVTPVLAELAKEGWAYFDGHPPYLERKYFMTVTRDAERQAVLEARNEVKAGENTYECLRSERITCGTAYRVSDVEKISIDTDTAKCLSLLSAFKKRVRINYIRDA